MPEYLSNIDFIKCFYSKYAFNSPTNTPNFENYFHPEIKVSFNNQAFHHSEIPKLIETFFTTMYSIKIDIVGKIRCLNSETGLYLVLSNWHCKTKKGIEGMCPMLEIFTIQNYKIVEAVAMMDTTEIGKF